MPGPKLEDQIEEVQNYLENQIEIYCDVYQKLIDKNHEILKIRDNISQKDFELYCAQNKIKQLENELSEKNLILADKFIKQEVIELLLQAGNNLYFAGQYKHALKIYRDTYDLIESLVNIIFTPLQKNLLINMAATCACLTKESKNSDVEEYNDYCISAQSYCYQLLKKDLTFSTDDLEKIASILTECGTGKNLDILNLFKICIQKHIKFQKLQSKDQKFWKRWGTACYNLNLFEEALDAFSQFLNLDKTDPMVWFYRALTYMNLAQYDEAQKDGDFLANTFPELNDLYNSIRMNLENKKKIISKKSITFPSTNIENISNILISANKSIQ